MATSIARTESLKIEILHCVPVIRPRQLVADRPIAVVVADANGYERKPWAFAEDGSPLVPVKPGDVFAVANPSEVTLYRVDQVGMDSLRGVAELSYASWSAVADTPLTRVTREALEAVLDAYCARLSAVAAS